MYGRMTASLQIHNMTCGSKSNKICFLVLVFFIYSFDWPDVV